MIDRHAVFQFEVGPLPDDVENWEDPVLGKLSDAILAVLGRFEHPYPDSDSGMSGHIIKRVFTDDELDGTNEEFYTRTGHYVSTRCLHGHHETCKGYCMYKDEHVHDDGRCQCHCHPSVP